MEEQDGSGSGDAASAHVTGHVTAQKNAHSTGNERKMERFMEKSESILNNFAESIANFTEQAKKIRTLTESVQEIKAQLNQQKRPASPSNDAGPTPKQRKCATASAETDSETGESDLDDLLTDNDGNENQNDVNNMLNDFDDFFANEGEIGAAINSKVAEKLNQALRPTKKIKEEKTKELLEKYKRPENVQTLECPKVDGFLWNQLKSNIKTVDIGRQNAIKHLNRAAVPLVMAINNACDKEKQDVTELKRYIWDSFKLICQSIQSINSQRREAIKKELNPKFKQICSDDHPTTATGLFGDNMAEVTKAIDNNKNIQMTNREQNFLSSGRGGSNKPNNHKTTSYNNSNYNNSKFKTTTPPHHQRQEQWKTSKGKSNMYGHNKAKNSNRK